MRRVFITKQFSIAFATSSMDSQAESRSKIILRPVETVDYEFLLEVYASTRAEEMAMVPWTQEQQQAFIQAQFSAQQDHYSKKYPTANHEVIVANNRRVGRLYLARLENEIRIVDLTVLPQERNAGIGTYLLEELLNEAQRENKVTRIYVEAFNPSLRLFERLGFKVAQQDGFHLLMEWTPLEH